MPLPSRRLLGGAQTKDTGNYLGTIPSFFWGGRRGERFIYTEPRIRAASAGNLSSLPGPEEGQHGHLCSKPLFPVSSLEI